MALPVVVIEKYYGLLHNPRRMMSRHKKNHIGVFFFFKMVPLSNIPLTKEV